MAEVKTHLFRKAFKRADGKRQLKIVANYKYNLSSHGTNKKRFEISILKNSEVFTVSDKEYVAIKNRSQKYMFVYEISEQIKNIILELHYNAFEISTQIIQQKLNEKGRNENDKKWNEFLNSKTNTNNDYSKENIADIEGELDRMESDGEVINEEDIINIADSIKSIEYTEKHKKEIEAMSLDDRYKNKLYDSSIIQVFGFCLSINPYKSEPYIADSYKSLIPQLADYFCNVPNVSNQITDMNHDWIDGFLMFKKNSGYPKVNTKGITPFNISVYSERLVKSSRKFYDRSTFGKIIKHLKYYIKILQENKLLSISTVNPMFITANKYIPRDTPKESYTRRNHTLLLSELEQLHSFEFSNPNHTLARDMYIIQAFAGGLRLQELYSDKLKVEEGLVTVYRNKTKTFTKNPILPHLEDVLKRHNYKFPEFLKETLYRKYLSQLVGIIGWSRKIQILDTKFGNSDKKEELTIEEIFKPYSARKLISNYLAHYGFTRVEIAAFTGHQDEKSLSYYLEDYPLERKQKLVKDKIDKLNNKK